MAQTSGLGFSQAPEPSFGFPPGPTFPQANAPASSARSLLPGTILRGGRYRLQALVERRDWAAGAFEATWTGHDLPGDKQVMICEVDIPTATPEQTLSIMRAATTSLLAMKRYPQIAPILDAFSDRGRSFFVFMPVQGETLLARLRRLQHPFSEREVAEFCLQMTDILDGLSQKSSPLVHGLISPEHVYLSRNGSQYILSNFSILVAGGATTFLAGGDSSLISPYTAPEFARGNIDTSADIYAVLATAYHLITGNIPTGNASPRASTVNPMISPAFDAILTRGLSFSPHQRYHSPSQLRQDLRAQILGNGPIMPMRGPKPVSAHLVQEENAAPFISGSPAPTAYPFPIAPPSLDEEEHALLPAPELLPPMRMGNDRREAAIILAAILLSLSMVAFFSNFHV